MTQWPTTSAGSRPATKSRLFEVVYATSGPLAAALADSTWDEGFGGWCTVRLVRDEGWRDGPARLCPPAQPSSADRLASEREGAATRVFAWPRVATMHVDWHQRLAQRALVGSRSVRGGTQ